MFSWKKEYIKINSSEEQSTYTDVDMQNVSEVQHTNENASETEEYSFIYSAALTSQCNTQPLLATLPHGNPY